MSCSSSRVAFCECLAVNAGGTTFNFAVAGSSPARACKGFVAQLVEPEPVSPILVTAGHSLDGKYSAGYRFSSVRGECRWDYIFSMFMSHQILVAAGRCSPAFEILREKLVKEFLDGLLRMQVELQPVTLVVAGSNPVSSVNSAVAQSGRARRFTNTCRSKSSSQLITLLLNKKEKYKCPKN